MIQKCPLNTENSVIADQKYGPARRLIQGGMKWNRNSAKKLPIISMWIDISLHHKTIELYIYILYERNSFPPYKFIQCHLSRSINLYSVERRQYHPRNSNSHQHVQIKRLHHKCIPRRQWLQHKLFKGEYHDSKFKHMLTRRTHHHDQQIHSNHQERSALHHTLFAIHKLHQAHENITRGMYNPLKKPFSKKVSSSKSLIENTKWLGKPNLYPNMKRLF